MEKLYSKLTARRATLKRTCAHALAALLLALFASAFVAAQVHPPAQTQQQQQAGTRKDTSFDEDKDDESESDTKEAARHYVIDPAAIIRRAHFVYVDSDSAFVSAQEIEDSLRKRKEFQAWGMVVTRRRSDADLVIEITRKSFSRRFTFIVLDPRTEEVVATGKMRSVLFGKKIPNKVAEQFANRARVYRPYP
jgi:Ni/Co efflux regulator RcnB